MMKRSKQLLVLLLGMMLLFAAAGCGSSGSGDGGTVQVQDPAAFLGIDAYNEEAVGENGGAKKVFWLSPDCSALCKEYVDILLGAEELELLSIDEVEDENGVSDQYFLGYTGKAEVKELVPADESAPVCHVFVQVSYVEALSAIRLSVFHAGGFTFADLGYHADTRDYDTVALPVREDEDVEVEEEKGATPAPQPSMPAAPEGPAFPDLNVFFHRECDSDEPDGGGRYIAFRGVPDTYADTLLNELYALLTDSRYHLEPAGYEEAEIRENVYRYDYLFDYTGMKEIEEVTYERIGEMYALRVMFVHYEEDHHLSIAFHFSDEFVLEDPDVVTSVKDTGLPGSAETTLNNLNNADKDESGSGSSGSSSGSGGSGGSGGGDYVAPSYDPYVPDASKLQCLTCRGDGDCNSCGGSGYKFKNDIRSDCTRCTGGNCPACGGSGTR